jgi:hypothetical protein
MSVNSHLTNTHIYLQTLCPNHTYMTTLSEHKTLFVFKALLEIVLILTHLPKLEGVAFVGHL